MIFPFRTGDVSIIEKLCENLCEKEIEQKAKRTVTTPLFIAAQHNQKKMVEHLLTACKDERTSNMDGVTPLLIAIREGNIEIVQLLLDKDSVDEIDNEDRNVFHYAFMSREPEKLTTMIKDFIEKTSESESKFSEKLQDLLTAKDLNENTPLHTLAEQTFELEYFEKIFTCLDAVEVLECFFYFFLFFFVFFRCWNVSERRIPQRRLRFIRRLVRPTALLWKQCWTSGKETWKRSSSS